MVLHVVVPFLNERRYLGELLTSLDRQRRPADRVVLVDDGSDDGSLALAEAYATGRPHVTVMRRTPRTAGADRLAGGAELSAFQAAVAELPPGWDVVAKLDADLRLPPGALAELERRLGEEPRLGIAGAFLSELAPSGALERIRIGDGHVHGATKFYRRACWEQIAPLPEILGWDTIDELRAQRSGWRTRSFALSEGDPVHLRARGSHDGALRAHRRWGRCAYAFGEPPLVAVLQSLRMLRDAPPVLGGLSYGLGYAQAAWEHAPRAEAETRAYVRARQLGRLRQRVARVVAAGSGRRTGGHA